MAPLQLVGILGIIFVILILVVIFLMPTEYRLRKRKKRSSEKTQEEQIQEWQKACLKLEKHVHALRLDVDASQKKEKVLERELLLTKEKNKKLQEKMSQERGWQEKEQADIDKKAKEVQVLKEDLKQSEQNLEREHSQRLLLEREAKEIKESIAKEIEEKRSAESQIMKLKAQSDAYRREISELRESNEKLSQKHEEKTFVSKSEYEKLEQLVKEKDKEIEKLKKDR